MQHPTVLFASLWAGVLCAGVISHTLAAEPPATAQSSVSSETSTAASASLAADDTKATEAKTLEAQTKKLRGRGYRPVVRNGKTVFCRKEATLGTRFESEVCASAEALDELTRKSKDLTETIQRPSGNIVKP